MPFKSPRFTPRIVRFDDEQPGAPAPVGSGVSAPAAGSFAGLAEVRPGEIESPPHDPTHDTIRGAEFDTLANWDPDDALLADPMLQCLARQLSDDAERLAQRYPAEGWIPPTIEECSIPPRTVAKTGVWRRAIGVAAAMAACAMLTLGSQSIDERDVATSPALAPVSGSRLDADGPVGTEREIAYQDGDDAAWGANPVDDSQYGNVDFGGLQIDGRDAKGGAFDVLSNPVHEALRELLPADSHEHCDVSM